MGLLYLGTPLTWDEAKTYADHVRYHGISQFLHIWDRLKDRHGDELLWGDEVCCPMPEFSFSADVTSCQIEYMVVSFDDQEKNASLSLRQTEILAKLNEIVDDICADCPEKYVFNISIWTYVLTQLFLLVYQFLNFTRNMAAICWNQPPALPTLATLMTYCQFKAICVTGGFSLSRSNSNI